MPMEQWVAEQQFMDWEHIETVNINIYRNRVIEVINELREDVNGFKVLESMIATLQDEVQSLNSKNRILTDSYDSIRIETDELRGRVTCLEKRQNYIPFEVVPQPYNPMEFPKIWLNDETTDHTVPWISVSTYTFTGKDDE